MPEPLTIDRLIEAGVHFGCRANRWNPKMKPFILGKRHLIHLIDLRQTVRGLLRAENFLARIASGGAPVLFVGTKRPIRTVVEEHAKRCTSPYVSERWIGGTLTNFTVIRRRLARLEELERMEEDGTLARQSKKMMSALRREKEKIARNLEGIRSMSTLPGAVVLVDPRREEIAAQETRRTGIPSICLLDTDCDPDLADIPIPGNDDAIKSVGLVLTRLSEAVLEGKSAYETTGAMEERASDSGDDLRPMRGDGPERRPRGPRSPAPSAPRHEPAPRPEPAKLSEGDARR
ncbi:MAG TPA: 30S ribosomal protein S2 [Planctomycetota bacterium]|nr:30S ribosomal protein S2 [Planctomycetota bacterium]